MTAGTVVITGGILASVILLLIIAVLCYCRLQVRLHHLFCSFYLLFAELQVRDCTLSCVIMLL